MALFSNRELKEECGIFGVYGHPEAAKLTYFGLYALQHRGEESAGIVVSDGLKVREHKGMGLVPDVFSEGTLNQLQGRMAIGHVRYSTTGSSMLKNAQPFLISHGGLAIAIAHNGNLTNAQELRLELENKGAIFQSTMDSEIVIHLIARALNQGLEPALLQALQQIQGAYSMLFLTQQQLIAARDPFGFRPLCLGRLNGSFVIASETCALDLVEAQYIRDIEPGEIVIIDAQGLRSIKPEPREHTAFCIFEYIYFARPDSMIFGHNVYQIRKRLGQALAREYQPQGDLVMPFPDSGNYAAIGFAEASGIPFEMGVIRNHYIGRTFIQPSQGMRDFGVRVKLNPVKSVLKGRRAVIVEDSIIRGTTSRTRIKAIRAAGATEVHMVVSCPPHRFPCFYGIDFSTRGELIACQHSVPEIQKFLELDSLGYLSLEGMIAATGLDRDSFCLACFDGQYPISPDRAFSKLCLEPAV
ncbi:MAG: amidophosphoribosyltransferase [Deltaproteobacteria bacterium]|nr:amidophosphoribosyltransferase [Deltaproteobacteria bacterium]